MASNGRAGSIPAPSTSKVRLLQGGLFSFSSRDSVSRWRFGRLVCVIVHCIGGVLLRNSKPCAYSQKSKFYFLSVYPPNACNYVAHLRSNSSTSVTSQLLRPFDSLGWFILGWFSYSSRDSVSRWRFGRLVCTIPNVQCCYATLALLIEIHSLKQAWLWFSIQRVSLRLLHIFLVWSPLNCCDRSIPSVDLYWGEVLLGGYVCWATVDDFSWKVAVSRWRCGRVICAGCVWEIVIVATQRW